MSSDDQTIKARLYKLIGRLMHQGDVWVCAPTCVRCELESIVEAQADSVAPMRMVMPKIAADTAVELMIDGKWRKGKTLYTVDQDAEMACVLIDGYEKPGWFSRVLVRPLR